MTRWVPVALGRRNPQLPALLQRDELPAAGWEPAWLARRLALLAVGNLPELGAGMFCDDEGAGMGAEITGLTASPRSHLHASNGKALLRVFAVVRGPSTGSLGSFLFSQGFVLALAGTDVGVERGDRGGRLQRCFPELRSR